MADRALDFATRKLLADTVRETVQQEIRDAAMLFQCREESPIVLHGPCSDAAERLVLGTVLSGELSPADVPLEPTDFWSQLHQRVWMALGASETLQGCGPRHWQVVHTLDVLGLVSCDLELIRSELEATEEMVTSRTGMRDVAAAVILILTHSRTRHLAHLLQSLTYRLTHRSATHEDAYVELRAHFAHYRGELPRPTKPPR